MVLADAHDQPIAEREQLVVGGANLGTARGTARHLGALHQNLIVSAVDDPPAEIFSSESITPWEPNPIYRFVPTQVDAPDHIKYRRILNPWFSPKAMEAAAPMMRELCRSFIEPLVAKGRATSSRISRCCTRPRRS